MTSGTTHRTPVTLPPQPTGFVGRQTRSPARTAPTSSGAAGRWTASERAAQDGLGEERYWQLRERGAAASLDQIIRFALADIDDLEAGSGA
jgi:hypothetical protein